VIVLLALRPTVDIEASPVNKSFQSTPSDGATYRPAAAAALCHAVVIIIIIIAAIPGTVTSYDDVIGGLMTSHDDVISGLTHIGACYTAHAAQTKVELTKNFR